jgi:hypothetical protein
MSLLSIPKRSRRRHTSLNLKSELKSKESTDSKQLAAYLVWKDFNKKDTQVSYSEQISKVPYLGLQLQIFPSNETIRGRSLVQPLL